MLSNAVMMSLEIYATLLMILLCVTTKLIGNRRVFHKGFMPLICMMTVTLFADVCSYVVELAGLGNMYIFITWDLTFALTIMYCVVYQYYLLAELNLIGYSTKWNRIWMAGLIIFAAIDIILWSLSPVTKWFYFFNEADECVVAPFIGFIAIMPMVQAVLDLVLIHRYRRAIGHPQTVVYGSFVVIPATAVLLQVILKIGSFVYLSFPYCAIITIATMLYHQHVEIRQKEQQLEQNKGQLMLSQIQPHFLYNTITSIMALCSRDPEEAVEALSDFSDYLRANLDTLGDGDTIKMYAELHHIETYLRLEKRRFKTKLNVDIHMGPMDFDVPTLTIQPIVENAVKHGVTQKKEGGTVQIYSAETDTEYLVIVEDDGVGMDPDNMRDTSKSADPGTKRSHVGLKNIESRLKLCCNGYLEIVSAPDEGTKATVHIPKQQKM